LTNRSEGLRRLGLFNEKAAAIRDGRFVTQVFHPRHGFTWITPGDGSMQTEWRGADVDATKALALDLRYFIWGQKRDHINLWEIRDLYESLPVNSEDKQTIRDLIDSLDETLNSTAIVIGAEPVTWRKLLEVFMYGGLAHANDDKRRVYEFWKKTESSATLMRHNFEKIVKAMVYAICQVRLVNERIIEALESTNNYCEGSE
jgi:hypothetical protein